MIHKTIQTYGEGESLIAEKLEIWEDRLPSHIKLAYLPSFGKVRLRLSGKGENKEALEKELSQKVKEVQELLLGIISGIEEDGTIEKQVGVLLKEKEYTLCTAESLTGGKIASTIVSVSGASAYFKGGIIAYTPKLKEELLGVFPKSIKDYSTVSKEVASEMALGAVKKLKTDLSIAVTGNAGPTTDNNTNNVGTVFIAIATTKEVKVHEFDFGQPREKVINRTVNKALELLKKRLLESD